MMNAVTINTDDKGVIIAIGNVKHSSIAYKYSVNIDELPCDIREHLGKYRYSDGMFEKVTIMKNFNQIDEARRQLYARICDPLISEAKIKRLQGLEDEATDMERQALAARIEIQNSNPWPYPIDK